MLERTKNYNSIILNNNKSLGEKDLNFIDKTYQSKQIQEIKRKMKNISSDDNLQDFNKLP